MSTLLPINEVFETLQGEASYTGTPSLFLRLQGCDVGCPWCDTKHTWQLGAGDARNQSLVLAKTAASSAFAFFTPEELVAVVAKARPRHVVITGGEPCKHDLRELTGELIGRRHSVQIETSGTQPVRVHPETFVTVSPKPNMPGGYEVRTDALERANEIKMPVGKQADIDTLLKLLGCLPPRTGRLVYCQPISSSVKATDLCREAAMAHNFRVSIQVHNLLNWR